MVDVDDRHAREELGMLGEDATDALELAAVADDDEVGVEVGLGRRPEAVDVRHEVVHRWHRVRADDVDARAQRLEREPDRERRSQRVGLRVAMADRHHATRREQAGGDLDRHRGEVVRRQRREPFSGHGCPCLGRCFGPCRRPWVHPSPSSACRTHDQPAGGSGATSALAARASSAGRGTRRRQRPWRQLRRQCLRVRHGAARLLGLDPLEELHDPRPALGAVVLTDVQVGDAPEAQLAEVAADEGHRALEGSQRRATLARVADDRRPDGRMAQVLGDLHARDRHEADARVPDLTGEDAADLLGQQVIEAPRALAHGASRGRRRTPSAA